MGILENRRRGKSIKKMASRLGVSVEELLNLTTDEIEKIQRDEKLEFKARGVDVDKLNPVIGEDISWSDIHKMVFRVVRFDRNGSTVDIEIGPTSVVANSKRKPYGYLLVESPTLNVKALLPIIHNNDFWLAATVFDDPSLSEALNNGGFELLATYAPYKILRDGKSGSPHHVMHFTMVPRGTIEKYYSDTDEGNRRMATPEPEILFGDFVYDGVIQVTIEQDPLV